MAALIALAVGGVALVVALFALFATAIVVDPGTIALVLRRGKATGRALSPGRHFVAPWQKVNLQIYPSRELSFVAGGRSIADPRVEYVDDPLRVHLGDKAFAQVSYTVRCQLDPGDLKDVHNRYGPEGVWAALRDTTRSVVLAEVGNGKVTIDDVYGDGFSTLEQRLTRALDEALGGIGFQLKMFNLREIDLGETGEVIQAIVRADTELEREQAFAKVRKARLENDAAISSLLDGIDGDVLLRYRQIEAWRDILHRWDGDQPIPSALTMPLLTASAAGAEHATTDEVTESTTDQP
ncbi:MAG TPA: SPFH domain-containing protein [Ilumatobacteraceae bacterium]|nr:SPFH domain-containing protein [Ilumatobacteraceae bacterium]